MQLLQEAIDELKKASWSKFSKEQLEVIAKELERLQSEKIIKNSLKVGDSFEDFEFLDINNKTVKLSKFFKDKEFLVIDFFRGGWCPYCNLELKYLSDSIQTINELNSNIISISPQTIESSKKTIEKNSLEFPLLSDVNNTIAKKIGLVFRLSDELNSIYKQFGIDIEKANGVITQELPMPSTYIIDKNLKIIFSFVDEDYTKRAEPTAIIEALKANSK